jgi:hypothetical protein
LFNDFLNFLFQMIMHRHQSGKVSQGSSVTNESPVMESKSYEL